MMKYTYKLNSRRNLTLKKRNVYGISSNVFIACQSVCHILQHLRKHLQEETVVGVEEAMMESGRAQQRAVDGAEMQRQVVLWVVRPRWVLRRRG
jgi:hypothetical protein